MDLIYQSEKSHCWIVTVFLLGFTCLVLYSINFPFFWDNTVQASAIAHFYFDHNFSCFFLPDSLDPGHPPFWGMLLALLWKVFGKALWVGRLMVLPFVWGIVWQVHLLAKYFIAPKWHWCAMLLILSDPTLLAQCTQVSPDVAMLFFFLLGVVSIIEQRFVYLAFAYFGISLFNLRGSTLALELLVLLLAFQLTEKKQISPLRLLAVASPFLLFVISYYGSHYSIKGWIRYHNNSNWETEIHVSSVFTFFKNVLVVGWRLIDFGRLSIWLALIGLVLQSNIVSLMASRKAKFLLVGLLSCLPFVILLLFSSEYILIRYLLNVYLIIALLLSHWLYGSNMITDTFKYILTLILCMALWLGNFLPYPKTISVGWDATLAHVSYFSLFPQMLEYLVQEKIPVSQVGSAFPNDLPIKYSMLSDDVSVFPEKDLLTQDYVLYSNVYNDFTDLEICQLDKEWKKLKSWEEGRIQMILYQKAK